MPAASCSCASPKPNTVSQRPHAQLSSLPARPPARPPATTAQAIADCCRSVAANPHYAKAHSRLATLLSELGYHEDAAAALEAAAAAPGVSLVGWRRAQAVVPAGRRRRDVWAVLFI